MGERPCEGLEKACAEAWEKWQESLRGGLKGSPIEVGLRRQYDGLAADIRACYEQNEVPPDEERWPGP